MDGSHSVVFILFSSTNGQNGRFQKTECNIIVWVVIVIKKKGLSWTLGQLLAKRCPSPSSFFFFTAGAHQGWLNVRFWRKDTAAARHASYGYETIRKTNYFLLLVFEFSWKGAVIFLDAFFPVDEQYWYLCLFFLLTQFFSRTCVLHPPTALLRPTLLSKAILNLPSQNPFPRPPYTHELPPKLVECSSACGEFVHKIVICLSKKYSNFF